MPNAARTICTYPGCSRLAVERSRCALHTRDAGRLFPRNPVSQAMYNSPEWKRIRREQLEREPWCRECAKRGQHTRATVADHIVPHLDDKEKFYHGELQSLCVACHAHKTNRELAERGRGA